MKIGIVVVGCVATTMAITVKSIYGLWYLSSDLVYVILFPQLVCVVYHKKHCNTYGSLAAYIVGFLLRALGGEAILGMPAIIKYPGWNEVDGQLFPFRTFAMLCSFGTLIGVSTLSRWVFEGGHLPANFDLFRCVINIPEDVCVVQEPHEEMTVLSASQALYYQTSEMNGRVNPALDATDDDGSTVKLLKKNTTTSIGGSGGTTTSTTPASTTSNNGAAGKYKGSTAFETPAIKQALAAIGRTNSVPSAGSPKELLTQQGGSVLTQRKAAVPPIESVSPGQVIITKL